jgi:hypothetical protein
MFLSFLIVFYQPLVHSRLSASAVHVKTDKTLSLIAVQTREIPCRYVHSDFIEYETKRSTPVAEKIDDNLKKGRMEEALTVFVAVEKNDEDNIEYAARQTAGNKKSHRAGKDKPRDAVPLRPLELKPFIHSSGHFLRRIKKDSVPAR